MSMLTIDHHHDDRWRYTPTEGWLTAHVIQMSRGETPNYMGHCININFLLKIETTKYYIT